MKHFQNAVYLAAALFGAMLFVSAPARAVNDNIGIYSLRGFVNTQNFSGTAVGTYVSTAVTIPAAAINCVYTIASHSGSPSDTFSLQFQDPSSNVQGRTPVWITVLSAAAITSNTSASLSIGRGVATASNAGLGVPLAFAFRTQVVATGGGSTRTGTVGCSTSN
jgi:hypothetical protein